MKVTNEEVLNIIECNPGISVSGIAEALPLTRASVNEKVGKLVAAGLVRKGPRKGRGIPLRATGKQLPASKRERVMLGQRCWTKEEDFLLESMAQSMPIELLIKKWPGNQLKWMRKDSEAYWPPRTYYAIRSRCSLLRIQLRPVMGLVSINEMSRQTGIHRASLAKWIKRGRLKAELVLKSPNNPRRKRVFISYKNLLEFLENNPKNLELCRLKGVNIEAIKEMAK